METTFSALSSFAVIPLKTFRRYVLSYEIVPLALCKTLGGSPLLSVKELSSICSVGGIDKKDIVLELSASKVAPSGFVPLSQLKTAWFVSEEAKANFIDRSYENFDVTALRCAALPEPVASSPAQDHPELTDVCDDAVNKFLAEAPYADGILALAHQWLSVHDNQRDMASIENVLSDDLNTLGLLLSLESGSEQLVLASEFLRLCTRKNIDVGWAPAAVLDEFTELSPVRLPSLKTSEYGQVRLQSS
ncbi:hypothetical protein CS022_18150 [Veronia nyctiphanis]|uniref:Uncharacterized protein n=1 Tax=Veronia nyctiphanis TaxID=1278244 RepID=A0A4Q0YMG2_9GAMM|nr:hypothetical protein [Veronia nyctiphanis]RXJ72037.1 hypothetical protein CS022_18055 [Veronia nyctiphanis]RXJ72052.1 hypothetical protein CS022_18150 [Veronia nyctiphanis]